MRGGDERWIFFVGPMRRLDNWDLRRREFSSHQSGTMTGEWLVGRVHHGQTGLNIEIGALNSTVCGVFMVHRCWISGR